MQIAFERADVLETFFPNAFGDEFWRDLLFLEILGMDADDQRLLIVASIENADMTTIGRTLQATPQVIVIEILRRGSLEGVDLTALRIDTRHHMLNRPIFAGSVHSLE